jgi:hypothetical protein
MVGNKNVVADMTNLHSKTEFSSVDEDSGRLTTTGKTPAVPSVHPAERAAVAAQIYGLVVKIWPAHCHFYASADYYGSHNAVIEQAKITDGFEIFLCRPSDDENGFRLEPVVGDWKELITGETSVGITPEVLLWRQEGPNDPTLLTIILTTGQGWRDLRPFHRGNRSFRQRGKTDKNPLSPVFPEILS